MIYDSRKHYNELMTAQKYAEAESYKHNHYLDCYNVYSADTTGKYTNKTIKGQLVGEYMASIKVPHESTIGDVYDRLYANCPIAKTLKNNKDYIIDFQGTIWDVIDTDDEED